MPEFEKFDFDRSRGVVWVCDVESSTEHLNDPDTVDDMEKFLPRLYWTAAMIVEAAGGRFVKWTGDGFMAWFETPLYRDLGEKAAKAVDAAWHLTCLVNVTQLGLEPERSFRIGHGITYEPDALLTSIKHSDDYKSLDITGRSVVLAFRLSGVDTYFPNISTQKEIVSKSNSKGSSSPKFEEWVISEEEELKFFKGEGWGTESIYVTKQREPVEKELEEYRKETQEIITSVKDDHVLNDSGYRFAAKFLAKMQSGPDWSREVMNEYVSFIRTDLLEPLESVVDVLEEVDEHSSSSDSAT